MPGRIGRLRQSRTLRQFADEVAAALPATEAGARVAGDLDRQVSTVAVAGVCRSAYVSISRCVIRGAMRMSPAAIVCTAAMIHSGGVSFSRNHEAPSLSAA